MKNVEDNVDERMTNGSQTRLSQLQGKFMTLCAFNIRIGSSRTGIVPLVNLTNPALQSSLVSRQEACARRSDYVT